MSRPAVWSLYALLVAIWSSTWVAIKIGLEDTPPLLGAGVRFAIAGVGLLALAAVRGRSLRTDRVLATVLAVLPFFGTYALVYWGEQYVPSGLAAVLFGVLPIYVALIASVFLRDEPLRTRLLCGVVLALGGLAVASSESVALGDSRYAVVAALGCALAPLGAAIGNVTTKRRGAGVDALVLNGWAAVGGGVLLLLVSAVSEDWGGASWTAGAVGSILYLAAIGTALAFVTLTRLLAELPAVTMSFIALLLPFGALVFGAVVYGEPLTAAELGGAALVAGGIAVAQWPRGVIARRRAAGTSGAPGCPRARSARAPGSPRRGDAGASRPRRPRPRTRGGALPRRPASRRSTAPRARRGTRRLPRSPDPAPRAPPRGGGRGRAGRHGRRRQETRSSSRSAGSADPGP